MCEKSMFWSSRKKKWFPSTVAISREASPLRPHMLEKQATKRWKRGALCLISAILAATALVSASPATAGNGPKVHARGRAGSAWFEDNLFDQIYLCDHAKDSHSVAVQLQYKSAKGRNRNYWRWNWWGPYKYNGCKTLYLGNPKDKENVNVAKNAQISYRACLGNHGHPGGKKADVIEGSCSRWESAYNNQY